ncbi:hypothetical protein [Pedococcus bigeumensis]|uniref:hypothetical protein n=1 Tax=Pedococcus bigeumensis TaxID=433644 RepID=UPI002FECA89F
MSKHDDGLFSWPNAPGPAAAGSGIRPFRLGDYGLLDLAAPTCLQAVQRALLWEWSTSPAGVIVRVPVEASLEDGVLGSITAVAAALVRMWPGTPIGLISDSSDVRDLVTHHPHGHHLVVASALPDVWDGLWSRGGKANVMVELPPTRQAPRTARDVVARACSDWHLDGLATPAARLTGDLVSRSIHQGASDIHFTVSRYESRVRLLARDDVPSTAKDELRTIRAISGLRLTTRARSGLDEVGEFAFDGHHVRWAVADAHAA